jgi:hypothetical protein
MTAITASFPQYHSRNVAFRAGVPAPVLPEGMRQLGFDEMNYVGGGGFWGKFFTNVWRAAAVLTVAGILGPIGGAIAGAALGAIEWGD